LHGSISSFHQKDKIFLLNFLDHMRNAENNLMVLKNE